MRDIVENLYSSGFVMLHYSRNSTALPVGEGLCIHPVIQILMTWHIL